MREIKEVYVVIERICTNPGEWDDITDIRHYFLTKESVDKYIEKISLDHPEWLENSIGYNLGDRSYVYKFKDGKYMTDKLNLHLD